MRLKLAIAWVALLAGSLATGSARLSVAGQNRGAGTQSQSQFQAAVLEPPKLVSAWPIEYPIRSVAAGVVVLELAIDDNGRVIDAIARHDIPSLTSAAVLGVKKWEYKAAMKDGEPVWSRATVAVMFNPPIATSPVELSPLTSDFEAPRHKYPPEPPDVASAFPAIYPFAYTGIDLFVALSVNVAPDGSVESLKLIHGLKPITETTEDAIKKWRFLPARYNGKAIDAPIAVAFVYRIPVVNNP